MQHPGEHNHQEHEDFSGNFPEKNPFSMPENYFEEFSKKLSARLEAEDELSAYPTLLSLRNTQPFAVPETYFDALPDTIDTREERLAFPVLSGLTKPSYIPPPASYFEALEAVVAYKAELANELNAYPALSALDKYHGFTVAPSYFETLSERLAATADSSAQEVVVRTLPAATRKSRIAWSIAALLVISLGLWLYRNPSGETPLPEPKACNTLACLEKNELLNDHTLHTMDEDNLFDMVNVDKLNDQLSKHSQNTDSLSHEQYILDDMNADQLMEEL